MAGRKRSRTDDAQKDFYLQKLDAVGPKPTRRVSAAGDYLKALLAIADPAVASEIGDRAVTNLLTLAAVLNQRKGHGK